MPLVQREQSSCHFCSPRETSVDPVNGKLMVLNPREMEQIGDGARVGLVP